MAFRLEYLRPLDNASSWGGALGAFGKGVNDAATWMLDRDDKNKENDRKDSELASQNALRDKQSEYYGANTDSVRIKTDQGKQIFSSELSSSEANAKRDQANADVQTYTAELAKLATDEQKAFYARYPLDDKLKSIASTARKTNPTAFEGLSDNDIAIIYHESPETIKTLITQGGTIFNAGNGVDENGNKINRFSMPYKDKNIDVPLGPITDENGNVLNGKGAGDWTTTKIKKDGNEILVKFNKRTGETVNTDLDGNVLGGNGGKIYSNRLADMIVTKGLGKDINAWFYNDVDDISGIEKVDAKTHYVSDGIYGQAGINPDAIYSFKTPNGDVVWDIKPGWEKKVFLPQAPKVVTSADNTNGTTASLGDEQVPTSKKTTTKSNAANITKPFSLSRSENWD